VRLTGRVRRLETACGEDTREARHVAAFLAALVVFGGGNGEAGEYGLGHLTTTAGLLTALRAWGATQDGGAS